MYSFTGSGCRIPLDIVELIIQEFAHDGDTNSLRACSVVCQDFAEICRKHIFSIIQLSDSSVGRKKLTSLNRFKRLLDKNPKIANYVRSVEYHNRFDYKRELPVLRRLRRVESFQFGFPSDDIFVERQKEWAKMSSSLRSSLFYFMRSNNIVELSLINIINLPLSIFAHLSCLTTLDLCGVSIDDGVPFVPVVTPKLLALHVGYGCTRAMRILASRTKPVVDLTCLENFSIFLEAYQRSMDFIRKALARSEKLISLCFSGCYPELDFSENLARCLSAGSLRTLKRIQLFPMLDSPLNDPYLHLTQELQKIAVNNVLEELILGIVVQTDRMCTTEQSRWSDLDAVLSIPGGFPFLRRVELTITIHWYSIVKAELEKQLWHICWNGFPRLSSSEIVEFTFNVESEEII